jgi:hypothetical protein
MRITAVPRHRPAQPVQPPPLTALARQRAVRHGLAGCHRNGRKSAQDAQIREKLRANRKIFHKLPLQPRPAAEASGACLSKFNLKNQLSHHLGCFTNFRLQKPQRFFTFQIGISSSCYGHLSASDRIPAAGARCGGGKKRKAPFGWPGP